MIVLPLTDLVSVAEGTHDTLLPNLTVGPPPCTVAMKDLGSHLER